MPSHHNRSKTHRAGVVASTGLLLAHGAAAAFNANDNVAVYWGQNSYNQAEGALAQQSLADYCANSNIDVIPMSFLVQVTTGQGGQPVINLANAGDKCNLFPDSALLDCPHIGEDIKTCQDTYNKTVLLSIGGATYTEGGFASEEAAVKAANLIWDTFGPVANSSVASNTTTNMTTVAKEFASTSAGGQNRTASAAASSATLDYDPQDPLWAVSLLEKVTQTITTTATTAAAATLQDLSALRTTGTSKGSSAERTANPTASSSVNLRHSSAQSRLQTAISRTGRAKIASSEAGNNSKTGSSKTENNSRTSTPQPKQTSLTTLYQTGTEDPQDRVQTIVDEHGTRFIPPGKVSSTSSSSPRSTHASQAAKEEKEEQKEEKAHSSPKIRTVNYDGTRNFRRQSPSSATLRPFGNAAVDGFDLDIEAPGQNFVAFANQLRKLMDAEQSKTHVGKTERSYYLTAAPQCPYPDLNNDAMFNGGVAFDALFVQFYNNYCGVQSFVANNTKQNNFNFEVWDTWATSKSSNPDVKIYLGVPAGQSAAGSGYTPVANLEPVIAFSKTFKSFGGVMAWDASQAYANNGFLKGVKAALKVPATGGKEAKEGKKEMGKRRGVRRGMRQAWWA